MSTQDVEEYFDFKLKKIFWINDFTCKGVIDIGLAEFNNEEDALKTLEDFTGSKVEGSSELEQFNWKTAKAFKEGELMLRVGEKNVRM
jgi:hypothetical protein